MATEQLTRERAPQSSPPTELEALGSLLPRIVATTVIVVVGIAIVRGGHGHKMLDRGLFVLAVAFAALWCVRFVVRTSPAVAKLATSACASVGVLVGIAWIEHPGLTNLLWEGFGVPVAIATVCISIYLWRGIDRVESSRWLRSVLTGGIAVVAACDLAALIRTTSFFADATNNVYILNEMLAPSAGRVPDATFVPQYINLYGWLLVPMRHFVSPWDLAQIAVIFLSCLAIASVLLAVAIAARTMAPPSLWLAAGLVIPLACVTGLHGAAAYSSINAYMQELAPRMFPNMLFSLLGLEALSRLRAGSVRSWHLPALGVLAGLVVWNSQDFGLTVVIAYCLLLVVGLPAAGMRSALLRWAGGLLAGFAVYPVLGLAFGTHIQLSDFAIFSRAYAGGFYSSLIQVPGPVLMVLPLLLASTAVGWGLLWRQRTPARIDSPAHDRAILTLALVGTWGTAGFVYYLDRSYASAQLQILLLPCGVCIVALISLGRDARARLGASPRSARSREVAWSLVPLTLLASLGFASMLQTPNPVTIVSDLTRPAQQYRFAPLLISPRDLRRAEAYVKARAGTLGYFGNNGSYVHLSTGLPTSLLVDDPALLASSPVLKAKACRYLAEHSTRWLLVSPTDTTGFGPPDLCGRYRRVKVHGLPRGTLFVRKTG